MISYPFVSASGWDVAPFGENARRHSRKQILQIARSIYRIAFANPVLLSDTGEILTDRTRKFPEIRIWHSETGAGKRQRNAPEALFASL